MPRPGNLEPTANGPTQDARWKRSAAERINYLLQMTDTMSAQIKTLTDRADTAKAQADTDRARIGAVEGRATALETKASAFRTELDDHEARIKKLENPTP